MTGTSAANTIVLLGAGSDPNLEADLATYRSRFHLPPCISKTGCFRQINYVGGKPYAPTARPEDRQLEQDVAVETAIDLELASAACPNCHLVSMQVPLVDAVASDAADTHRAAAHFATGTHTAYRLGARAVGISYGFAADYVTDFGDDAAQMRTPGMAISVASGDDGFAGANVEWPADLPSVTAVGGTSLYPNPANNRGYTETAWTDGGSGCATDLPPADGQPTAVSAQCNGSRAVSDISVVANPITGVAAYSSYAPGDGHPLNFFVAGGTSVGAPFVAGLYGRGPRSPHLLGPNTIYTAPSQAFHDIVLGANDSDDGCRGTRAVSQRVCRAGVGWDGPTGVGTPNGTDAFTAVPGPMQPSSVGRPSR